MSTSINFNPVGDRVIVKPDPEETMSTSGILLIPSKSSQELPTTGEVVALGEGGTFPECPNPSAFFKIGEKVIFNKYAGEDFEMKVSGEKVSYKVLRLDAIFGIIKHD